LIKKSEKMLLSENAKSIFFLNFALQKALLITFKITIMSKTIELQIEKSRNLVEGLRKHLHQGVGGGVNDQEINEMAAKLQELQSANEECDRLRAELSPKVKRMNAILAEVKAAYSDKKKTLKGYYPQEQWAEYGVPDKR